MGGRGWRGRGGGHHHLQLLGRSRQREHQEELRIGQQQQPRARGAQRAEEVGERAARRLQQPRREAELVEALGGARRDQHLRRDGHGRSSQRQASECLCVRRPFQRRMCAKDNVPWRWAWRHLRLRGGGGHEAAHEEVGRAEPRHLGGELPCQRAIRLRGHATEMSRQSLGSHSARGMVRFASCNVRLIWIWTR